MAARRSRKPNRPGSGGSGCGATAASGHGAAAARAPAGLPRRSCWHSATRGRPARQHVAVCVSSDRGRDAQPPRATLRLRKRLRRRKRVRGFLPLGSDVDYVASLEAADDAQRAVADVVVVVSRMSAMSATGVAASSIVAIGRSSVSRRAEAAWMSSGSSCRRGWVRAAVEWIALSSSSMGALLRRWRRPGRWRRERRRRRRRRRSTGRRRRRLGLLLETEAGGQAVVAAEGVVEDDDVRRRSPTTRADHRCRSARRRIAGGARC